jgi:hypothetical protein
MAFPKLESINVSITKEEELKLVSALNYAKGILEEGEPDEIEEVISKLKKFSFLHLLKMSQMDKSFLEFCRKNEMFHSLLVADLKDASKAGESGAFHPTAGMVSLDGVQTFSVFDFYLAAHFENVALNRGLSQQYKIPSKSALDYACELGLYDALLVRSQINFEQIKKSLADSSNTTNVNMMDSALKLIISDSDRLCNIYRELGYIQSALRFYALSTQPFAKEQQDAFLDRAIKNMLCADRLIGKDSISADIKQNILGNDSVMPLLQVFLQDNNIDQPVSQWEDLKYFLSNLIGKDRFAVVEKQAAVELADKEKLFDEAKQSKNSAPSSSSLVTQGGSAMFSNKQVLPTPKVEDELLVKSTARSLNKR